MPKGGGERRHVAKALQVHPTPWIRKEVLAGKLQLVLLRGPLGGCRAAWELEETQSSAQSEGMLIWHATAGRAMILGGGGGAA